MSISNTFQTAPGRLSNSLRTRLWHSPTLTVARFTFRSYIHSGWILGNIVFIWLLYAIFYLEFGGDTVYFFGTANPGLGLLAVLGTIVMTQRAVTARMYLPLARLTSRGAYIRGLIIASSVLVIPAFLLLMAMAVSYHRFSPPPCNPTCIAGATFTNMLLGGLGLIINCIIVSALTVVLSRPIATRRIQIVFLAWLLCVLYSNSNLGLVAQYLSWTRIPLAPLIVCFNLGTTGIANWYDALMMLVALGYIIGLTLLAQFWFTKRDLILY